MAERIASGDRGAMKDFYDSYSGYLTAVCYRYVVNRDDARDILQECFIKILASIGKFEYRGEGALRAWAGRIVVNESLKYLRDRKRPGVQVAAEEAVEPDEEEYPDVVNVPTAVIMEMIRSLPDGYRTVFNLYVFEKKSHREIASILNIAENSSASQLHRAKSVLVKMIKKYSNG